MDIVCFVPLSLGAVLPSVLHLLRSQAAHGRRQEVRHQERSLLAASKQEGAAS